MPTDLEVVFARIREAKAQSDANTTMLLICGGLCLALLVLLFGGYGVAEALELMGEIEF
jgi:hypothetical protein